MSWTWLGIATLALLAFSVFNGFRHGFVREVISTFFVLIALVAVWFVNPYVNDFLRENTPVYDKVLEGCHSLVDADEDAKTVMGAEEQESFIENLALPGFLKSGIEENNNAEVYKYLAVDTFTDYVADYLAVSVINGLSFAVSFILVSVIIRLVAYVLNILAKLPVINGVNKLAGAALGGVKFLIFIWIALLILSIFCNTEFGRKGLELVENDTFLNFLSQNNIFTRVFMSIFYGN